VSRPARYGNANEIVVEMATQVLPVVTGRSDLSAHR
jgi:predicted TIM-barrel enzyme